MTTEIATATGGITEFRAGVDDLINRRSYFISRVLPILAVNADFYVIKGRRSLSKGGAEKLLSVYGLTAIFHKDSETLESFGKTEGVVAYVCTLKRGDNIVGQGRGAAVAKSNGGDINKTIKMAQKSSFIDAVIRTTGLSDIFTQDLESMPEFAIQSHTAIEEASVADDPHYPYERSGNEESEEGAEMEPVPASERQISYLRDLAMQNLDEGAEKEQYMANIESLSRSDCSEAIKGMLAMVGR